MTAYDAIVLGLGAMGSAAARCLARRGLRVLGLEQFPLGHARGSSHGHTRIIRTAYYEHPDYIPLVRRAFALWRELESDTGHQLLTDCDCLSVGAADGGLIRGVSEAAARLAPGAVRTLTAGEIRKVFPFAMPDHFEGRLEHDAGYLFVEDCVASLQESARRAGAELHADEPALAWTVSDAGVAVTTSKGTYEAAKLVVTAGAWAAKLLAGLGVPLTVMRQTMQWHAPKEPELFQRGRFPIFLLETPGGDFYGLPRIDDRGVKVARHYGAPELATPDAVDWTMQEADVIPVRAFLDSYLPNRFESFREGQVCMYTLTPDRHFVIDRHPGHANVAVAAGFSGHGFKFAPTVGELLAGLLMDDAPPMPMFAVTRMG